MNANFVNDVPVYSITFGSYNTWERWHLFPTTRPLVAPPKPVTKLEKVNGYNGYLDYTKILSNYMTFSDREGNWDFRVIETSHNSWANVYNDIVDKLDGKYFDSIVLQDEPAYKYKGRLMVNSWKNNQQQTTITIKYRLYPYKILVSSSLKDWVWDDLDLTSSVDDIYFSYFRVDGSAWKSFINPSSHSVPLTLTCAAPITMATPQNSLNLIQGVNKNCATLQPGVNTFHFTGNCDRVDVEYNMDEESL